MTVTEQVEAIDLSIEAAKEKVVLAAAIRRLYKNKDFKKVFIDHFMVNDVSRTVKALAEPALQDQASQLGLQKRLAAVGQFNQFMIMTERMGDMAEKAIADDEEYRESILREDV